MPLTKDHLTSIRAEDVMTGDVITVRANQQLSTAAQKLLDHRQMLPLARTDMTTDRTNSPLKG